ncbi:SCO3933 family regulatory protein [Embleya hyalina]|uniref:Regulatory protein n=1 Tax=Embleya hyalina TaxID=516124 RepID=A0A401YUS3_9ACTN|nr:hypothetical protein [Embleya hyalina]GCD98337.1 hypothetical protein EHYA_06043 [Embleya hyalina]
MRSIPVDTSAAMLMCATEPQVKLKDLKTGEVSTDRDTGATLYTVGIVFIANGAADVVKVTVPEPGLPNGLTAGSPLVLTGLVALPWENNMGGQMRHGVAFRASAVALKAA